jgi:hypothetical protein
MVADEGRGLKGLSRRGHRSAWAAFRGCHKLAGIEPGQTLPDIAGRPLPLLDDREPIAELL